MHWLFVRYLMYIFIFFFFQAEDGIRDLTVTGVQTCALPILGIKRSLDHRIASNKQEIAVKFAQRPATENALMLRCQVRFANSILHTKFIVQDRKSVV